MSLCVKCNVNEAVVFAVRQENGKSISEGYCLKCAMDNTSLGMADVLRSNGITPQNVDEIQSKLNEFAPHMSDFNLQFNNLFSNPGEMGLDKMFKEFDSLPGDVEDDNDQDDATTSNASNGTSAEFSMASTGKQEDEDKDDEKSNRTKKQRRFKFLEQFSLNLTNHAKEGKIDPVIGRKAELDRVVQILNRRTKNNPALIGEPGVGKTAIAEGLALRLATGEAPAKLLDFEVYLLDLTAMLAGTQYRGQFEARLKGVIDDVKKAKNVILVIDEMHNLMGAGDADGAMNAANILKPALARGEIRVIGSTTLKEYRRFIEKDSALERRFQKVLVNEPTTEETLLILQGLRPYYEEHHHVTFSDSVLAEAVRLSERYINDRFLPDKAIDLLDEAGSRANLDATLLVTIKREEQQIAALEAEKEELFKKIYATPADEERAKLYEDWSIKENMLTNLKQSLKEHKLACPPAPISFTNLAEVVELWTGIPVTEINATEEAQLLDLENRLHQMVVGQNEAVSAVSRVIRSQRTGMGQPHRPASFIFVGPTGVGKTELAKSIAKAMFHESDALIRLDMSEFMERHTVSKLIGSPPGYVGYDDRGQLTEQVRKKPYSVILFDEIEKAHADVSNMLLQILDDGRLTDSHGKVVNFEHAVIIMTSNAGTSYGGGAIGFGAAKENIRKKVDVALKELFRPEFINRIGEVIVFDPLQPEEIREILDLMLVEIKNQAKLKGVTLSVSEQAKNQLAKQGYDNRFGARPLRRLLQREVADRVAEFILHNKNERDVKVCIDYLTDADEGRFVLNEILLAKTPASVLSSVAD